MDERAVWAVTLISLFLLFMIFGTVLYLTCVRTPTQARGYQPVSSAVSPAKAAARFHRLMGGSSDSMVGDGSYSSSYTYSPRASNYSGMSNTDEFTAVMFAKEYEGRESDQHIGHLHIRMKYDFDKSQLVLHLIEGYNLRHFDIEDGALDPYINIRLDPPVDHRIRQVPLKRHKPSLYVDKYFTWPIDFDDNDYKTLLLELYDFVKNANQWEIIGEVELFFQLVDFTSTKEFWCDIEATNEFEDGGGELLISLTYKPDVEKLTVFIMKARDLIPTDDRETINPVVTTSLQVDGKTLKCHQTKVVRSSTDPIWNEAHVLDLPQDQLDKASLEFKVSHQGSLFDRDLIGVCWIGNEHSGMGEDHWQEITQNSGIAAAKWHMLQPK